MSIDIPKEVYDRVGRNIKIGIIEQLIEDCEKYMATMILLQNICVEGTVTVHSVKRKIIDLKSDLNTLIRGD